MPLQKIQFKPGFNKQQTAIGAEGQWIDGDNSRFRRTSSIHKKNKLKKVYVNDLISKLEWTIFLAKN